MYEGEYDTLCSFLLDPHPNLIRYEAAVQIDGRWSFVFPWADKGSLHSFWAGQSPQDTNPEYLQWALDQIHGLSSALAHIHSSITRHGDLKPENILVFADGASPGKFIIADVGLARKHSQKTAYRPTPTTTMTGTWQYEPPEADRHMTSSHTAEEVRKLPRVYDVWCMGCICLKFVIWLLWSKRGLQDFEHALGTNRFWDRADANSSVVIVHPMVEKTINWLLEKDPRCAQDTAFGDLLTLIRNRLLIVQINKIHADLDKGPKMRQSPFDSLHGVQLNGQRRQRAEAAEFQLEMASICKRASSQPEYIRRCINTPAGLQFSCSQSRSILQDSRGRLMAHQPRPLAQVLPHRTEALQSSQSGPTDPSIPRIAIAEADDDDPTIASGGPVVLNGKNSARDNDGRLSTHLKELKSDFQVSVA